MRIISRCLPSCIFKAGTRFYIIFTVFFVRITSAEPAPVDTVKELYHILAIYHTAIGDILCHEDSQIRCDLICKRLSVRRQPSIKSISRSVILLLQCCRLFRFNSSSAVLFLYRLRVTDLRTVIIIEHNPVSIQQFDLNIFPLGIPICRRILIRIDRNLFLRIKCNI